jgi:putative ABC transport system substrate-binding protein
MIGRRDFLTFLGATAAAWPAGVRAQPPMPLVGFLSNISPDVVSKPVAAFRRSLSEAGFTEGQNVTVEYRWAEGNIDRLPKLAAELVERQPAVIVATGGGASALVVKSATSTIPIVFTSASDPVELGLVASLSRPGGNITGVHVMTNLLEAKRLGLLLEMVPTAATVAVLVNPNTPGAETQLMEVRAAAHAIARNVHILKAVNKEEIDSVFAELAQVRADALLVAADPFFNSHREQLVALTANLGVPAIYEFREFTAAGGLMAYGISLAEAYHQVGLYTGRILKGAKPSDLPVVQPTKFELFINLKTARTIGITVPPTLLARADEVIE